MSSPNQLPAYVRYLKARLQPFGRPAFWISALWLLLIPLFAWEYWKNPNWFSALEEESLSEFDNPQPEPTLSSEELAAISADIDSSTVLINEFDRAKTLATTPLPEPTAKKSEPEKLVASLPSWLLDNNSQQVSSQTKPTKASEQKANPNNPFAQSVQDFLNLGSLGTGDLLTNSNSGSRNSAASTTKPTTNSIFDSILGLNSLNPINTNQQVKSTSALQEALNRVSAQDSATRSNSEEIPANTESQTSSSAKELGQRISTPTTLSPATGYKAPGQVTYPPASVTSPAGGYNAAGQLNYPPVNLPSSGGGYNAAGQLNYPPTTVPGASDYNSYPTVPTSPTIRSNVGQYSTQSPNVTNGVPNTGFNSTPNPPGLQQSGLTPSGLRTPRR
ncbi:MAG TPA: hypothetical protein DC064_18730 [Cyanobacteria bacterium UBA9273]|nr:hypothetical protein [Cyanobacteria bacterium UBA9273]